MFLTFINVKKEFQPSTYNFMNDELFQRCFRDNYLRNNAFVLIHIVRKRHYLQRTFLLFSGFTLAVYSEDICQLFGSKATS